MKKRTPLHTHLGDVFPDDQSVIPAPASSVIQVSGETHAMEKMARCGTHVPEKLERVIREIQQSPNPDHAYLYDRALGAGEVYGPNNNGDWFGDHELRSRHHTFENCAHVYRHHKNKQPKNKTGDILASAYNDPLSTVDLILKIPAHKVKGEVKKLQNGGTVATSMGARVKQDVCSICGNKARARSLYCHHLKNDMLDIYDDGRQVFAKNPNPRFVDLSFVVIRAAPESVILKKIAKLQSKSADMRKESPSMSSGDAGRPTINKACIEATNNLTRPQAIKTIHDAVGTLRPDEFQAVIRKDASLLRPGCIPEVTLEPVEPKYLDGRGSEKLASLLRGVPGHEVKRIKRQADFLEPIEKRAYLQYRKTYTSGDHRYLR